MDLQVQGYIGKCLPLNGMHTRTEEIEYKLSNLWAKTYISIFIQGCAMHMPWKLQWMFLAYSEGMKTYLRLQSALFLLYPGPNEKCC